MQVSHKTAVLVGEVPGAKIYDKAEDVPLEEIEKIAKAIEKDGTHVTLTLQFSDPEEAGKFGQMVVDWLNNNKNQTRH